MDTFLERDMFDEVLLSEDIAKCSEMEKAVISP